MSEKHNTMLSISEKKGVSLVLSEPIAEYVSSVFEQDAETIQDDLDYVDELRSSAINASTSLETRKDALQKYYRALCAMETRFPISKETAGLDTVTFTWHDCIKPTKKCSHADIRFEKAATLFNIAAIHTQLGENADRSTADGIKLACHHFQMAAGIFVFLRDTVCHKLPPPGTGAVDVTKECVSMFVTLMLAQAQECFHEKTVADNKSPGIVARLAKQVHLYYGEVTKAMSTGILGGHFDKVWVAHVSTKAALFNADHHFRSALTFDPTDKIGCRISRLRQATAQLADAKQKSKGLPMHVMESVHKLEAIVAVELQQAEKDNKCVYMEQVPSADTLPPVAPHSLVKPLPVPEALVQGTAHEEGLFRSIVPDSSTKAMSKYTEMVDSMMREQMDLVEEVSARSEGSMAQWELEQLLAAMEGNPLSSLPDGVKAQLDSAAAQGPPASILANMADSLRDMQIATVELVEEAEQALAREAEEDQAMRDRFGSRWDRPPSHALNASSAQRLQAFRDKLSAAAESDRRLVARVQGAAGALAALTPEGMARVLPKLEAPMLSVVDDAEGPALAAEVKRLQAELLHIITHDRREVEQQLRSAREGDDILSKMMASADGAHDTLFQEQLKRYEAPRAAVAAHAARQREVLQRLDQQQTAFRRAFEVDAWKQACHAAAASIGDSLAQYSELRDNIGEGIEFYSNMQDAIAQLSKTITDFTLSRKLQKSDLQKHLQSQQQAAQQPPPQHRRADQHHPPPSAQFAQLSVAPHSVPAAAPQFPRQPLSPPAPAPASPSAPAPAPAYSAPQYHPAPGYPSAPAQEHKPAPAHPQHQPHHPPAQQMPHQQAGGYQYYQQPQQPALSGQYQQHAQPAQYQHHQPPPHLQYQQHPQHPQYAQHPPAQQPGQQPIYAHATPAQQYYQQQPTQQQQQQPMYHQQYQQPPPRYQQ